MKRTLTTIIPALALVCLCAFCLTALPVSAEAAGSSSLVDVSTLFTERDLEQTADLSKAEILQLQDGNNITITKEGVYVIRGTVSNATVVVEAPEDAKVQIVLDGVAVANSAAPCIYVKSADKVFVTTCADSTLKVTGTFSSDGSTKTDGVIFSKDDLVLNGTARLTVSSTDNGVVSKDDLKITGGSYVISAAGHALEANDSIRVAGGTFTLTSGKDSLHAENDDDTSLGYIYIADGSFTIQASDDAIHAEPFLQIDGGTFSIRAAEGIESTYIQINGGTIDIQATDDGINGTQKSSAYRATVEITGGDITVAMGSGDTDGVDSNGDLIITGGTVCVTGNSCFDVDGSVTFTGGTVYVNGQQVSTIPNQMMGGGRGGMSGWGGNRGGRHG